MLPWNGLPAAPAVPAVTAVTAMPATAGYCFPTNSYLVSVPANAEPMLSVQAAAAATAQMAATSAAVYLEPPHVLCIQQQLWAQLSESSSPMTSSPALSPCSPMLRSPVEAPSPTQLPQPTALQRLARPVPQQQLQRLARQTHQQQPTPACDKALTRGARRRIQQRLRKKMGKLERALALSGSMGQAALPQQELKLSAHLCEEEELSLCPTSSYKVEECPVLMMDKATHLPALGELLAVPSLGDEKIVPVCAIQSVSRLEDMPDIETKDTFVELPFATRGAKADNDSHAQAPRPRSPKSLPRCETWPRQSTMQIPSVNTFVHFHLASDTENRRRSRSV